MLLLKLLPPRLHRLLFRLVLPSPGSVIMSGELSQWVDQIVNVVTCDGRIFVGIFRGYDQRTNLILASSHERVYSLDAPIEQVPRGLLLVRGDNVACLGPIDEARDLEIDFETTRGEPLKPIVH